MESPQSSTRRMSRAEPYIPDQILKKGRQRSASFDLDPAGKSLKITGHAVAQFSSGPTRVKNAKNLHQSAGDSTDISAAPQQYTYSWKKARPPVKAHQPASTVILRKTPSPLTKKLKPEAKLLPDREPVMLAKPQSADTIISEHQSPPAASGLQERSSSPEILQQAGKRITVGMARPRSPVITRAPVPGISTPPGDQRIPAAFIETQAQQFPPTQTYAQSPPIQMKTPPTETVTPQTPIQMKTPPTETVAPQKPIQMKTPPTETVTPQKPIQMKTSQTETAAPQTLIQMNTPPTETAAPQTLIQMNTPPTETAAPQTLIQMDTPSTETVTPKKLKSGTKINLANTESSPFLWERRGKRRAQPPLEPAIQDKPAVPPTPAVHIMKVPPKPGQTSQDTETIDVGSMESPPSVQLSEAEASSVRESQPTETNLVPDATSKTQPSSGQATPKVSETPKMADRTDAPKTTEQTPFTPRFQPDSTKKETFAEKLQRAFTKSQPKGIPVFPWQRDDIRKTQPQQETSTSTGDQLGKESAKVQFDRPGSGEFVASENKEQLVHSEAKEQAAEHAPALSQSPPSDQKPLADVSQLPAVEEVKPRKRLSPLMDDVPVFAKAPSPSPPSLLQQETAVTPGKPPLTPRMLDRFPSPASGRTSPAPVSTPSSPAPRQPPVIKRPLSPRIAQRPAFAQRPLSPKIRQRPMSPRLMDRPPSPRRLRERSQSPTEKRAFTKPTTTSLPSPRRKASPPDDEAAASEKYVYAWRQAKTPTPPMTPRAPGSRQEYIHVTEERAFAKPAMTSLPSPRRKAQATDPPQGTGSYVFSWRQKHEPPSTMTGGSSKRSAQQVEGDRSAQYIWTESDAGPSKEYALPFTQVPQSALPFTQVGDKKSILMHSETVQPDLFPTSASPPPLSRAVTPPDSPPLSRRHSKKRHIGSLSKGRPTTPKRRRRPQSPDTSTPRTLSPQPSLKMSSPESAFRPKTPEKRGSRSRSPALTRTKSPQYFDLRAKSPQPTPPRRMSHQLVDARPTSPQADAIRLKSRQFVDARPKSPQSVVSRQTSQPIYARIKSPEPGHTRPKSPRTKSHDPIDTRPMSPHSVSTMRKALQPIVTRTKSPQPTISRPQSTLTLMKHPSPKKLSVGSLISGKENSPAIVKAKVEIDTGTSFKGEKAKSYTYSWRQTKKAPPEYLKMLTSKPAEPTEERAFTKPAMTSLPSPRRKPGTPSSPKSPHEFMSPLSPMEAAASSAAVAMIASRPPSAASSPAQPEISPPRPESATRFLYVRKPGAKDVGASPPKPGVKDVGARSPSPKTVRPHSVLEPIDAAAAVAAAAVVATPLRSPVAIRRNVASAPPQRLRLQSPDSSGQLIRVSTKSISRDADVRTPSPRLRPGSPMQQAISGRVSPASKKGIKSAKKKLRSHMKRDDTPMHQLYTKVTKITNKIFGTSPADEDRISGKYRPTAREGPPPGTSPSGSPTDAPPPFEKYKYPAAGIAQSAIQSMSPSRSPSVEGPPKFEKKYMYPSVELYEPARQDSQSSRINRPAIRSDSTDLDAVYESEGRLWWDDQLSEEAGDSATQRIVETKISTKEAWAGEGAAWEVSPSEVQVARVSEADTAQGRAQPVKKAEVSPPQMAAAREQVQVHLEAIPVERARPKTVRQDGAPWWVDMLTESSPLAQPAAREVQVSRPGSPRDQQRKPRTAEEKKAASLAIKQEKPVTLRTVTSPTVVPEVSKREVSPAKTAVVPSEKKEITYPASTVKKERAAVPIEKKVQVAVPTEKKVQVAVPTEKKVQVAVPTEKKVQVAVPVDKKVQVAVPIEKKVQVAVPTEKKVQVAIPIEKKVQVAVPKEKKVQVTAPVAYPAEKVQEPVPTEQKVQVAVPVEKIVQVDAPVAYPTEKVQVAAPTDKKEVALPVPEEVKLVSVKQEAPTITAAPDDMKEVHKKKDAVEPAKVLFPQVKKTEEQAAGDTAQPAIQPPDASTAITIGEKTNLASAIVDTIETFFESTSHKIVMSVRADGSTVQRYVKLSKEEMDKFRKEKAAKERQEEEARKLEESLMPKPEVTPGDAVLSTELTKHEGAEAQTILSLQPGESYPKSLASPQPPESYPKSLAGSLESKAIPVAAQLRSPPKTEAKPLRTTPWSPTETKQKAITSRPATETKPKALPSKPASPTETKPKAVPSQPASPTETKPKAVTSRPASLTETKPKAVPSQPASPTATKPKALTSRPASLTETKPKAVTSQPASPTETKPKAVTSRPASPTETKPKAISPPASPTETKPKAISPPASPTETKPKALESRPASPTETKPKARPESPTETKIKPERGRSQSPKETKAKAVTDRSQSPSETKPKPPKGITETRARSPSPTDARRPASPKKAKRSDSPQQDKAGKGRKGSETEGKRKKGKGKAEKLYDENKLSKAPSVALDKSETLAASDTELATQSASPEAEAQDWWSWARQVAGLSAPPVEVPGKPTDPKYPKHVDLTPMYRFMCETVLGIPPKDRLSAAQAAAGQPSTSEDRDGDQASAKKSTSDQGIVHSIGAYSSALVFRVLFGGHPAAQPSVPKPSAAPSQALANVTRTMHAEHPVNPHVEASIRPAHRSVSGAIHEMPFPGVGPAQSVADNGFPSQENSRVPSATNILKQSGSRYSISTPVFGRFGGVSAYPAFYSNQGSRHMLTTEFDPEGPSSSTDPLIGLTGFPGNTRTSSFTRGFEGADRSSNAVMASRRSSFVDLDGLCMSPPSTSKPSRRNYSDYSVLSVRRSFQIRKERMRDSADMPKK